MSFLKAKWQKLIMVNYEIDPNQLNEYVPKGTSLDFFDGKCFVSLIGFMFKDTKLLGFKVPCHVNFEEVNLRFYVKREVNGSIKRGVVFIKEIVPKPALTLVANAIYKEHYVTLPMTHEWVDNKHTVKVKYSWKLKGDENFMSVTASKKLLDIQKGSLTEFIAEHYWGYSKASEIKTTEYEVRHPKWQCYKVDNYKLHVDFEANYGQKFKFLSDKEPSSVMLLEGSHISVENKKTLP